MVLGETECWARLVLSDHAVLGTMHPGRGIDAVPVVFTVVAGQIVVPIDTLKAKSGRRLQRLRNLDEDRRCVLLVDHYESDWSALWWVRVHGQGTESNPSPVHLAALAERYPPYRAPGAVIGTIVMTVDEITGWAATPPPAA